MLYPESDVLLVLMYGLTLAAMYSVQVHVVVPAAVVHVMVHCAEVSSGIEFISDVGGVHEMDPPVVVPMVPVWPAQEYVRVFDRPSFVTAIVIAWPK